jgi:hypothetical protein
VVRVTAKFVLAIGALFTTFGLAVASTTPIVGTGSDAMIQTQPLAGGVLVIVGWILLAWGIHRLGRQPSD